VIAITVTMGSLLAQRAMDPGETEVRKLVDSLRFESGKILLSGDLATLTLPENLRYLNPSDTDTVLTKLWGNPPQAERSLGMIVPADVNLLSGGSWAVLITYEEDGHVNDNDASSINYDKLLEQMQEGAAGTNAERKKLGYEPIQLVGWAAPPRYDAGEKKLYWAKELQFGDDPEHTLNCNIRILGRTGVLNLNAIASMAELSMIEKATPELLSAVSFNPGQRYADFDASTDKLATYGVAALVAGGVAAKAGFFKLFGSASSLSKSSLLSA
jgi:uncharacterized membrane-anchored protein